MQLWRIPERGRWRWQRVSICEARAGVECTHTLTDTDTHTHGRYVTGPPHSSSPSCQYVCVVVDCSWSAERSFHVDQNHWTSTGQHHDCMLHAVSPVLANLCLQAAARPGSCWMIRCSLMLMPWSLVNALVVVPFTFCRAALGCAQPCLVTIDYQSICLVITRHSLC